MRTWHVPANSDEDANSRGESLLIKNEEEVFLKEPLFIFVIGIVFSLLGDWRFGIAICFSSICLFFEEIIAENRKQEREREIKQAELQAEEVRKLKEAFKSINQNLNSQSQTENKNDNRNIAR